ncbi:MAG: hypothetical protein ABIJ47_04935 [Candidatus Bathyarchaeota archaeon]|uniref:Uncharacterized protein n=1 Tax=viral metagenome TaxID=1070528 RepID=A0A6M3M2A7_9ZZZZ
MAIDKSDSDLPVVVDQPLLIVSPENAKAAMQAYQELCSAVFIPWDRRKVENGVIVQESDYQRIPVRHQEGGRWITEYKDFPKKSAWRKLGKFYKISDEIVGEPKRVDREDGSFVYHYTVKAIAPDGQYTFGIGSCDSKEIPDERRREHDTESKAHTRAKNRAISDLIGFGQVSAEEVTGEPKFVESQQTEAKPSEEKPRAKVGPPPRRTTPKPAAGEPKPEEEPPQGPPRSVEDVIERIAAFLPGHSELVVVSDRGEYYRVGRLKMLDKEIENHLDFLVTNMGGEWNNEYNEWRIEKEAEGR